MLEKNSFVVDMLFTAWNVHSDSGRAVIFGGGAVVRQPIHFLLEKVV